MISIDELVEMWAEEPQGGARPVVVARSLPMPSPDSRG